ALLFVLVNMAGAIWLRRPEAWLISLVASMILAYIPLRLTLGRPYLITVAAIISILYLWRIRAGAPPRKWDLLIMAVLAACSTFFHGAWYLWVLPLVAFFLAGRFFWCFALGGCWIVGVVVGSALTGHPLEYPMQAVRLASLAIGAHFTQRTMVSELQPFSGDTLTVLAFVGLLLARMLAKTSSIPLWRDPAFWLAAMCWVLGFRVARFWLDWGWPALMVLAAFDLQLLMETRLARDSFKRLGLVCCIGLAAYLCVTSDFGSRWSSTLTDKYLDATDPKLKGWMPDKGGIFYTADMSLFYQTFYKNPDGDWRYMLGFEPTWMPKKDFDIYQRIVWNFNDGQAYKPWVDQMTRADRLVVRAGGGAGPPDIGGLKWKHAVGGIWIGRLPRTNSVPMAPKR
ncbi:MAG: hypothetical protein ACREFR_17390, partial [Limisphaerales bacterium]